MKHSMQKIDRILKEVRNRIKPDVRVIRYADDIVKNINSRLKEAKISAECVKGGSIAKDTYLKNDYDIDLFIRYNTSYREGNISDITDRLLQELCSELDTKLDRIHGSRDYFQFNIKKSGKILAFEVIPVLLIRAYNYQDAQNITDLSPEHVDWVKRYTSKNPRLTDDIRLAKQFCKANKVYGAESYINGFSGHILDILVIHYKSFLGLITAFSKYDENSLKKSIIIDTEKNLKNPLKQLNKSKITSLIIIDPIQKDRNSAAALSKEKLLMFINAAKRFIENPNRKFFEIVNYDIDREIYGSIRKLKLQKNTFKTVKISIDVTDGSKDVIGTKALKAYESIIAHMTKYGFKVLHSDWNFRYEEKRAEAYILIDSNISQYITQEGPPTAARDDYKKFIDKHTSLGHEIVYKDSRVLALVPRKFTDPKKYIEDLSRSEFISKKIKNIFIR
ncbi:MAG: nucleotidyltransferase domain-containing protein [Candidatus Woesearchaeota archaeon]